MLTLTSLYHFLYEEADFKLSEIQKNQIKEAYDFLSEFSKNKIIYGINTGFGPMAQYKIEEDKVAELQYNLIRSHSNGIGESLSPILIKSVMISRLNTLALGYSGVSPELSEVLENYIGHDICPVIPQHGGVGASGDLVQLAHLAYGLIGEGECYYKGELMETKEALSRADISPLKLKLRDGLALINGTSCMTGVGAVNLISISKLLYWSTKASSVLNELTASYDDSFSESLNNSKLHRGQREVAEMMRSFLKESELLKKREQHLFDGEKVKEQSVFKEKVQEYYSLRCVPQILGPVLDAYTSAKDVVEKELNSANDNPIISVKDKNVYHGGNFHGDYIAYEMDKLKIGVTKMTMLMERQLNYLLNAKLNEKFHAFLNAGKLGFNFGLQGMQFTAVSTTAENQTLSNPMSVHSIPNNGDNQDIVSMGTNAALILQKVVDNAYEVLAIHLVAVAQAMDLSEEKERFTESAKELYTFVREEVEFMQGDHSHSKALGKLKLKLKNCDKGLL